MHAHSRRPVLSSLAADRCVAFALEAIETNLSPDYIAKSVRLPLGDRERNILATYLRKGFDLAFASDFAEHVTGKEPACTCGAEPIVITPETRDIHADDCELVTEGDL